ncbi:MAG: hypothetical protein ABIL09_04300 [Gemmatimonadota bacterium]
MTQAPPCNIGADGRRFRLFFGILLFLFSCFLAALLSVWGAPLPLRVVVFLPAWCSGLCLFQARAGTCVFLAARGAESTAGGTRPVADPGRAAALQRRAASVHLRALLFGFALSLLLTAAGALVPWTAFFAG